MKWALFFALLLLLRLLPCAVIQSSAAAPTEAPLPSNETDGPKCAQWLYGTEPPQVEAFQCVEQPDDAEDKFCCGTCGQALSCSFQELAEGSAEGPIDGSAEGPIDGSAEGPTDRPECLPSTLVQQWERVTLFFGGAAASIIFYLAVYHTCRRCRRRKRSTCETQEGIELQVSSSERSRDSPDASNALAPPSSAGAEGLQNPQGASAAVSTCTRSVQTQTGGPESRYHHVIANRIPHGYQTDTIMWYPTGFVPIRIGPNSSMRPSLGGRRPLPKPGK